MPPVTPSTGLSITNPLVLYRALLSTKRIDPDPAQHRLAIHLQKLYERLKDYEPVVQYGARLNQISRALGSTPARPAPGTGHDAARVPLGAGGILSSVLGTSSSDASKEGMALTKVLTSQEAAMALDSPKGLMLHGEVGTGKSMLVDLFADCLPNRKKRRWHYTSFMLHTTHKLEQLRRSRQLIIPSSLGQQADYSLLWLARDLISTSPILFLDEFQLPDRAAAKIMTNLMTCFFHLGGVLIATSNRMPEELAKAAGVGFAQPRRGRPGTGGWTTESLTKRSDFAQFLDVLKARCEVWQMEGSRDYRRREAENDAAEAVVMEEAVEAEAIQEAINDAVSTPINPAEALAASKSPDGSALPRFFFVRPDETDSTAARADFEANLSKAICHATSQATLDAIPWGSTTLTVYGRRVTVPRAHAGVTYWTFAELCETPFGPADYITLASHFHTLVLRDVPVLSLMQKNEARRLITLLDALYEARCKLIVSAAAGPDGLFFPEARSNSRRDSAETVDQDQIMPETLAEIYQDATAPFRPNVSAYSSPQDPDPGVAAPAEPDATHARFAGMLRDEARAHELEDTPPHSMTSRGAILDTGDGLESSPPVAEQQAPPDGAPDFQRSGIYTGDDERFAYKRARSRLWEMCGTRWWSRADDPASESASSPADPASTTTPTSWWTPTPASARPWERPPSIPDALAGPAPAPPRLTPAQREAAGLERDAPTPTPTRASEGAGRARAIDAAADAVLYREGAAPFRGDEGVGAGARDEGARDEGARDGVERGAGGRGDDRVDKTAGAAPGVDAPSFAERHIWGQGEWGPRAGRWGRGPAANRAGAKGGEAEGEGADAEEYVRRREVWRRRETRIPGAAAAAGAGRAKGEGE